MPTTMAPVQGHLFFSSISELCNVSFFSTILFDLELPCLEAPSKSQVRLLHRHTCSEWLTRTSPGHRCILPFSPVHITPCLGLHYSMQIVFACHYNVQPLCAFYRKPPFSHLSEFLYYNSDVHLLIALAWLLCLHHSQQSHLW